MNRAGWLRLEEIFQVAAQDGAVIERIAAAQRAELEEEIGALKAEAERLKGEARELVGEVVQRQL